MNFVPFMLLSFQLCYNCRENSEALYKDENGPRRQRNEGGPMINYRRFTVGNSISRTGNKRLRCLAQRSG